MAGKQLCHAVWCISIVTATCGIELSQQSIEEGKQQYELLKLKTELPNYGECWTAALEELRRDCRQLDDVTQSRLALQFASCFLQTSGQQPISCEETGDVRPCLRRLSDRQFDSYREFFTHTQNMCSFLQMQVWHRQTGRLIARLGSEAAAVAERLERSGSVQADILRAQQRALGNQQQLMEHGRQMSRDVDSWRENLHHMVQDFREQTAEHRDLILTVFERLTSLQQLVLDRFSWFNSLAHYVAGVLLVYLLTSTARTAGARLWLFLVLTANLALERLLAAYFISAESPIHAYTAQQTGAMLDSSVWLLRRAAVSLCLLILAISVYRYRDLNAANNQLLLELHRQHRELRGYLAAKGVLPGGDSTDHGTTGHTILSGLRTVSTSWPRRALSRVGDPACPRSGPLGSARRRTAMAGSDWQTISAGGDVPDSGTIGPLQDGRPWDDEDAASDSVSVASDVSAVLAAGTARAGGLHSRTSVERTANGRMVTVLGSLELSGATRSYPGTPQVTRSRSGTPRVTSSRSGTPQPSPGRYNLRTRPGVSPSIGPPPPPLQSPATLSQAVHRMEALTEQQRRLVRRALRQSQTR